MGIVVKGRENVLVILMIWYGFDRARGTLVRAQSLSDFVGGYRARGTLVRAQTLSDFVGVIGRGAPSYEISL